MSSYFAHDLFWAISNSPPKYQILRPPRIILPPPGFECLKVNEDLQDQLFLRLKSIENEINKLHYHLNESSLVNESGIVSDLNKNAEEYSPK